MVWSGAIAVWGIALIKLGVGTSRLIGASFLQKSDFKRL